MLTLTQLKKIMPNARHAAEALPIINTVAKQYGINNERRMAAWLATLAAESGELKYQEEIASGSAYEGRADLGNTQKGDGRRFKGHGRIQITGRDNHTKYTNYLRRAKHLPFVDFVEEPKKLAQEPYATDAAGWFWTIYKGLNKYADSGDFLTTQIRVNGRNKKTGLPNHYDVRQRYYAKGLSVLPDDFTLSGVSQPAAVQTATDTTLPSDEPQNSEPPTNIETTVVEAEDGVVTSTTTTTQEEAEIEGVKPYNNGKGLGGTLKDDAKAILPANIGLSTVSEWIQQTTGWPPWVSALIPKLVIIGLVCTALWVIYRLLTWAMHNFRENERVKLLAIINSDKSRKDIVLK